MTCYRIIAILLSTLIICCDGALQAISREENSLNRCVYNLLKRFNTNHLTLIGPSSISTDRNSFFYSPNRMYEENRWTVTTKYLNGDDFDSFLYQRPTAFIITVKTLQQLNLVLENLTKESRSGKFLVIFQAPLDNPKKIVTKTMKYFFNRNKVNLKIMAPDSTNSTRHVVYSWMQPCGRPRRHRFVYCSFGTFLNGSLLMNHKALSRRCSIKAVHTGRPPYSGLAGGDGENKGIEENIMETVASVLHLKVVYDESRSLGSLYSNGSVFGNFQLLKNGSADILFGAYSMSPLIMNYFQGTINHMDKELSWCAPLKPIFSYGKTLEGATSSRILTYAMGLYLGTSFVTWCISNVEERQWPSYDNFVNCFITNFCILVGAPVRLFPRSRRLRLLMVLFGMAGLTLNTFYSSDLTGTLISPSYTEEYEDLSKIYEDNLRTYASPSIINYLSVSKPKFTTAVTAERILAKLEECPNMRECLDGIASNNSVLFLNNIDRDYLMTQKKGIYAPQPLFHCTEQFVYKFLLTMYVRKDFPLLDDFNKVIRRIMSSGLIIKWKKDVVGEIKPHAYSGPMIKFEHLAPLFEMYLWAQGLAVVVFLVEIIAGRQ